MTVRLQLPDRRPLWTQEDAAKLATEQAERTVKRIKSGRGSDGRRFKRKADGSPSTLLDTGRLHASITGASGCSSVAARGPSGTARRFAATPRPERAA